MAHSRLRDVLMRSLDSFGEHDGVSVLRLLMDEIRACTMGVMREFVSAIELSRSEDERVWLGEWVRVFGGGGGVCGEDADGVGMGGDLGGVGRWRGFVGIDPVPSY
jgi:hypothetical protein